MNQKNENDMPGGRGNIKGSDGNTFSSTNQPKNRRKSTKFLTDLLIRELKGKKEIYIDAIDPATNEPIRVKVPMTTKETIVQALLRQAAKGNTKAIEIVFERTDGKVSQPLSNDTENPLFNQPLTDNQFEKLLSTIRETSTNSGK